ncbi:MAG: hypothetical protein KGJ09_10540 [Candidatus Omnitrophica bacterium]|nr:hypothetical protein [Candidatus Omnitrophota bacterium]MDE2232453.1 hypothetical protein [Candidatus Omnitrophota bacterium]
MKKQLTTYGPYRLGDLEMQAYADAGPQGITITAFMAMPNGDQCGLQTKTITWDQLHGKNEEQAISDLAQKLCLNSMIEVCKTLKGNP